MSSLELEAKSLELGAKAQSSITIRRGTAVGVLTPSTEADFDYINGHLRDMDKFEQDHCCRVIGESVRDSLGHMEKSWTLNLRGEIVGYVALQVPPGCSPMSNLRNVPMISTTNVAHHPIDYVRLSRPILQYVVSQAPSWVDTFISAPFKRYAQSVKWQEKTMGWHRVGEFDMGAGETAVLLKISRKELA